MESYNNGGTVPLRDSGVRSFAVDSICNRRAYPRGRRFRYLEGDRTAFHKSYKIPSVRASLSRRTRPGCAKPCRPRSSSWDLWNTVIRYGDSDGADVFTAENHVSDAACASEPHRPNILRIRIPHRGNSERDAGRIDSW